MKQLALLVVLVGCFEGGRRPEPMSDAEQVFLDEALPVLQARCVACHGNATGAAAIAFMAGDSWVEIREALLASPVVVGDPARLLTKGVHEGPSLTRDEAFALRLWIDTERAAN